jgi:hypothetical protein
MAGQEEREDPAMKRFRFAALVALVGLAAGAIAASGPRDTVRSTLDRFGAEAWTRAGLDKLSDGEREALGSLVVEVPVRDQVASSAEQYLLRDGWEVIALYGSFKSRDAGGRRFQFAVLGPSTYLVYPWTESETLLPGYYLVDKVGSTMDVLSPEGKEIHYWIEKEL